MKAALGSLTLAVLGPGFLAGGSQTLRTGLWRDGIPAAELLIDRTFGLEPPDRTAWDRRFARGHAWMRILFGSFFPLCLVAVVCTLFL